MAKRRAGGGEEKGNWLDTYADMVTLLLCFFEMQKRLNLSCF